MINNTSIDTRHRLSHKQLDQQFLQEVITGLSCSRFEASAILDTVYRVYAPYFETSAVLKPGQLFVSVVSEDTPANVPLERGTYVTVVLTLDAGDEDVRIRHAQGVQALRRHRMQRMCIEAYQQGGLLTVEDLAYRLLNCGVRTLSRDLEVFRRAGVVLPLRSTIKDMGRAPSHRALIIEQWLQGKEFSEIARHTHHSISSVQNYVGKFKRIVALAQEGYDIHTIAFLVKVSIAVAETYHALSHDATPVAHRQEELDTFLKKTLSRPPDARCQ
jgi:hypothetical protein